MKIGFKILIIGLGVVFFVKPVFAACPAGYTEAGTSLCCKPATSVPGGMYKCDVLSKDILIIDQCCHDSKTFPGIPPVKGSGKIISVTLESVGPTTIELGQSIFGKVIGKLSCSPNSNFSAYLMVDFGDGHTLNVTTCNCSNPADALLSKVVSCNGDFTYTYQDFKTTPYKVTPKGGVPPQNPSVGGDSVSVLVMKPSQTSGGIVDNPLDPNKTSTIGDVVDSITDIIFYILSAATLVLLVIGGMSVMTAAGSPNKVSKGKQIITGTLIGYAVILISRGIVELVMRILRD